MTDQNVALANAPADTPLDESHIRERKPEDSAKLTHKAMVFSSSEADQLWRTLHELQDEVASLRRRQDEDREKDRFTMLLLKDRMAHLEKMLTESSLKILDALTELQSELKSRKSGGTWWPW